MGLELQTSNLELCPSPYAMKQQVNRGEAMEHGARLTSEHSGSVWLEAMLLLACLGNIGCGAGQFEWQMATPESQGISPERLAAISERMAEKKTRAFLVVRNDHIVCER